MALITCPDCGKDVSERAETCMFCGAPIKIKPTYLKIRFQKVVADSPFLKATVKTEAGKVLGEVKPGGVMTYQITEPLKFWIDVTRPLTKKEFGPLTANPGENNNFSISQTPGLLAPKFCVNRVDVIDSE